MAGAREVGSSLPLSGRPTVALRADSSPLAPTLSRRRLNALAQPPSPSSPVTPRTLPLTPFPSVGLPYQKRSPEAEEAHEQKLLKGEKRKRNKLAEAGIDYDFPGYEAALAQRTAKRATKAKAA
jgi:hypothetical protein